MGHPPFAINLSTACLAPLPLATALRLVAEAGFDGVEMVIGTEIAHLGAMRVAVLARAHGLRIHTIHQPLSAWGRWRRLAARAEDGMRLALELGCAAAVIHSPHAYSLTEPSMRDWLAAVARCVQWAQGSETRLALENPPYAARSGRPPLFCAPDELACFAREHGLAITFDACHAGTAGLDLLAAYHTLRPQIVNIHLSDRRAVNLPLAEGRLGSLLTHHQMPGAGDLPLSALLRQLSQDGYSGPVSVEVNPFALANWHPGLRRRNLRRILAYARAASEGAATELGPEAIEL